MSVFRMKNFGGNGGEFGIDINNETDRRHLKTKIQQVVTLKKRHGIQVFSSISIHTHEQE